jgi:hypothetical protein
MRRVLVLSFLALALAAPAAAVAYARSSGDGTLSVRHARGLVVLNKFNGAVIGRIGKGTVTISDPIGGDGSPPDFWGCDKTHDVNTTTTTCVGTDIRFRAIGGRWMIKVKGGGIYLSAVGHGIATLDGRGDVDGLPDGVFSINDAAYAGLPDDPEDFLISAGS